VALAWSSRSRGGRCRSGSHQRGALHTVIFPRRWWPRIALSSNGLRPCRRVSRLLCLHDCPAFSTAERRPARSLRPRPVDGSTRSSSGRSPLTRVRPVALGLVVQSRRVARGAAPAQCPHLHRAGDQPAGLSSLPPYSIRATLTQRISTLLQRPFHPTMVSSSEPRSPTPPACTSNPVEQPGARFGRNIPVEPGLSRAEPGAPDAHPRQSAREYLLARRHFSPWTSLNFIAAAGSIQIRSGGVTGSIIASQSPAEIESLFPPDDPCSAKLPDEDPRTRPDRPATTDAECGDGGLSCAIRHLPNRRSLGGRRAIYVSNHEHCAPASQRRPRDCKVVCSVERALLCKLPTTVDLAI